MSECLQDRRRLEEAVRNAQLAAQPYIDNAAKLLAYFAPTITIRNGSIEHEWPKEAQAVLNIVHAQVSSVYRHFGLEPQS